MEDQSIYTNSQPQGGISENLQRFIDAMVEEIVLEGKPFDTEKKYLKKFSENEGLDYGKLEADITTFIEILDSLKTAFSKLQVKLAEEKGRECHISEETVKKLVGHSSQKNQVEKPEPVVLEKPDQIKNDDSGKPKKKKVWPWIIGLGTVAVVALIVFLTGGHDYVDLGLPSGTLWATCNIGATKPEDYGNYYAWGETNTKNTYNRFTYIYANEYNEKLTKYCNDFDYSNNGFTDNLTALQTIDDPATANWGGGWRTPTKAQWDELLANTTNQWTTKNGVSGRLFTSKKNGQTLFLPAAGDRWDSELLDAGSYGNYWSRSLYTDYPSHAWNLYFDLGRCGMSDDYRSGGFSVRPVRQN